MIKYKQNNGLKALICVIIVFGFNLKTSLGRTVHINISEEQTDGSFPLVSSNSCSNIYIDSTDYKVVATAAKHFVNDVEMVASVRPAIVFNHHFSSDQAILIGTIGHSALIDELIQNGKLDASKITGQWESFAIATVDNPLPGLKQALVIAGSDRRGTAYGVFTLSESIGVSPWYWWADIVPEKRNQLYVEAGVHIQTSPSVKYRGIFINDEGFGGLNVWARKTYETEIGDIGPKTYAKVFELMLRLKANYCWPAMHACTKPFYSYPDNPVVADEYGIVIGTSHCEQMHCNTMTEWDVDKQGAWNYKINPDRIKAFWEDRIRLTQNYENIYTLGMRGTEDIEMEGAESVSDMVDITQQTLGDQRQLLSNNLKKEIETIPQVLCTYKEVLVTYQNGLDVPDDVTLLWADDNHGYTRQLCTPEEQKRSGGSGVYYHLSLLGTPEGYLWLNTISPSLVAYEMTKAYEYGADRIWMFNIGDIKPHEKELTFAMQIAWDINRWRPDNAHLFMKEWAAQTFGVETAEEISELMQSYYELAAAGKPEHCYRLDYSRHELDARIEQYRQLSKRAKEVKERIFIGLYDAYYQLIEYPILGCRWMNERNLLSRRSLIKAAAGDKTALKDADQAIYCHAQLDSITTFYNEQNANGKWNHMMKWHPWMSDKMPPYANEEMLASAKKAPQALRINLQDLTLKAPLQLKKNTLLNTSSSGAENGSGYYASYTWQSEKAGIIPLWIYTTIPTTYRPSYTVEVNGNVHTSALKHIGNIWHTQAAAPIWYNMGEVMIEKGVNTLKLTLPDSLLNISGIYLGGYPPVRNNAKQHIMADTYSQKQDGVASSVHTIHGLGLGCGVSTLPFTSKSLDMHNIDEASWLEYKIQMPAGASKIEIRTLPTQRIHEGRGVRFVAVIDDQEPVLFDIHADEFTPEWQDNVIQGFASQTIDCTAQTERDITLRIYFLDPGVVLRDVVIY